jgi:hypothetical protein
LHGKSQVAIDELAIVADFLYIAATRNIDALGAVNGRLDAERGMPIVSSSSRQIPWGSCEEERLLTAR